MPSMDYDIIKQQQEGIASRKIQINPYDDFEMPITGKMSPTVVALESLEAVVANIRKTTDMLGEGLQPVLCPPSPNEERADEITKKGECELIHRISQIEDHARAALFQLNQYRNRLML